MATVHDISAALSQTGEANPFRELWKLGYTSLVPIIPPKSPISVRSSIAKRLAAGDDARGKVPGVKWPDGSWSGFDWLAHQTDEKDCDRWHKMRAGVGVRTGGGLIAIDADIFGEEHATLARAELERRFGVLPTRIGRAPKAIYVARVDGPLAYCRVEFGELGSKGTRQQRVEILTEGKQFVAYGTHPGTGAPYRWTRRLVAFDDLPVLPAVEVVAYLEWLRGALPNTGPLVAEGGAGAEVDHATLMGEPSVVESAVRALPNDAERFATRESYLSVGYAIKAALPDDGEMAFGLFQDWCDRWTGGRNEPDVVEADWSRMKGPFRRGADFLYRTSEECSGGAFSRAAVWFEKVEEPPPSIFGEHVFGDASAAEPVFAGIRATPYGFPEPSAIPKRETLYGCHYVRQFVSTTVAPSKVGKSSLEICEALAMASGKPLLGAAPSGPLRVWLWNGEDPIEELQRRVAACMMHYGLTREDVGDRLFVDTGRHMPIVLATAARDGARIAEPVVRDVIRTIEENRIDVFQVDPFVSSHRVSENDNNAIDMVAKRWAYVADVTRCAVELVHHVRKLNGAEVTVEDGRGAIALIAASRSARALARMTTAEGAKLGLSGVARRLFRFADTSSNLALPADGEATAWFELASVLLGNGGAGAAEGLATREDGVLDGLMSGDSVGVVRRFDMTAAVGEAVRGCGADGGEEGLRREAEALAELESGDWRLDPRAGDAWAGRPIARAHGLDIDTPDDKARAKMILSAWIKSGKLREVSRKNKDRKTKSYVQVVSFTSRESGDVERGGGQDVSKGLFD